jgi:hypothetical protein
MYSCPLEPWFATQNQDQELRRVVLQCSGRSSACWRGYVGTWEIRSNTLYLIKLRQECTDDPVKITIDNVETNIRYSSYLPAADALPMPAPWFSGTLRVPQGKELRYVHMGFGSIYERDLFLQITNGVVEKEYVVNNKDAPPTVSQEDLQWVALGGGPAKDDGDWIDARLIPTPEFKDIAKSGTNFRTRGIFFNATNNEPATLNIPNTQAAPYMALPLHVTPKGLPDYRGCHVEISAHFVADEDGYLLHVDKVRLLQPGETMHKEDYKPPNNLFQDTANEQPEGDPFADPEE